jgi:hypothetical protein
MANTYTLIASNVLSSNAASVTFSAIPSTYTDLELRITARTSSAVSDEEALTMQFNSDTGNNYSDVGLYGKVSVTGSTFTSNTNKLFNSGYFLLPTSLSGSNVFSSTSVYIPSYAAAGNKQVSGISSFINITTPTRHWTTAEATLYRSASVITALNILCPSNFVSGSSFYLYGIKNT